MRISGDWIEAPATQAVMAILEDGGHQALFVGGCVRNALLGVPVKDIDIATDAPPRIVLELAGAAGLKAIPTGLDHGTVTVISGGSPYEITTFRTDERTDGRRAVIAYAGDLAEDVKRRDFTMNALYARRDGTVIDPLDGLPDLLARKVRFVGDPVRRIREDYLRILRFFRFYAWYGDAAAGMDAQALAAIADHVDGVADLSRERVGAEVTRLLSAPDPAPSMAAMRQTGVLRTVLPGADDTALALLVHTEKQAGVAPDAMRRLAALGGAGAAARLRLSKAQTRLLDLLRAEAGRAAPPLELGYRHGRDLGLSILVLRTALLGQAIDTDAPAEIETGAQAVFPIAAEDLMPAFSGHALGAELRRLEAAWLAAGCRATRADLLGERRDG